MTNKNKIAIFIMGLSLLSGCASYRDGVDSPHRDTAFDTPKDPNELIAYAASSIDASLQRLAAVEQASTPEGRALRLPNPTVPGMMAPVSIDWYGPVGALVKKIAEESHYQLRVMGKEPAIPIIVVMSEHETPLATILRNAAFQAGEKAKVVVFPSTRTIELRYANS